MGCSMGLLKALLCRNAHPKTAQTLLTAGNHPANRAKRGEAKAKHYTKGWQDICYQRQGVDSSIFRGAPGRLGNVR